MRVLVKWLYVVAISAGAASVLCLVFFFGSNFLIAPQDIDRWMNFYFEQQDGIYFLLSVLLVTVIVIPFIRKMDLV